MIRNNSTAVPSASALKAYRISYLIHDGDHEYTDWFTVDRLKKPSPDDAVKYVVGEYGLMHFDEDNESDAYVQEGLKEYNENGWFTMPHDYRIISHVTVEPHRPEAREVLSTILKAWPQFHTDEPIPADQFLHWTTSVLIPYLAGDS